MGFCLFKGYNVSDDVLIVMIPVIVTGQTDVEEEVSGVTVFGDYAYIADGSSGLRIISVADPEHPEEVGFYDTDGYAQDITVSGDYAYVASWQDLRVITVADPEHPEEVGYYDTPGRAYGVALSEDGLIYVADGTNVGIYRFTDPAEADDPAVSLLVKFNLSAAYPNPFNSFSTIRYNIPYHTHISLGIYDPLGRQVGILFEGYRQAGFHSANMNASSLPSGVYFLKLEATGFNTFRKIALIR